MYLVDTSVWVDYIQGRDTPVIKFLDDLLLNPLAVNINDQIYLEILQGARNEKSFDTLQRYFSGQRFASFEDSRESHERAARLYFDCRRNGITIRSSIDCLIARCALEHDLVLLHHDRDYIEIGSVITELKQKHFLNEGV
jgi:predicted nucleic acid-binding protein